MKKIMILSMMLTSCSVQILPSGNGLELFAGMVMFTSTYFLASRYCIEQQIEAQKKNEAQCTTAINYESLLFGPVEFDQEDISRREQALSKTEQTDGAVRGQSSCSATLSVVNPNNVISPITHKNSLTPIQPYPQSEQNRPLDQSYINVNYQDIPVGEAFIGARVFTYKSKNIGNQNKNVDDSK